MMLWMTKCFTSMFIMWNLFYPNQVSQTIFQSAGTLTYAVNLEYAVKTTIEHKSDGKELMK